MVAAFELRARAICEHRVDCRAKFVASSLHDAGDRLVDARGLFFGVLKSTFPLPTLADGFLDSVALLGAVSFVRAHGSGGGGNFVDLEGGILPIANRQVAKPIEDTWLLVIGTSSGGKGGSESPPIATPPHRGRQVDRQVRVGDSFPRTVRL
jgi:hypothetical protein